MAEPDDFDPTHALDGWRVPPPAPVDLELAALPRGAAVGIDEAKKARLKARGYADIEDIDVLEVRPNQALLALRELAGPPVRSTSDPRLLPRWQPLAWTALARRVRGAAMEVVQTSAGPRVQSHAAQWLCALWPPQQVDLPLLGRWPELAALVAAETAAGALVQLLAELPPRAQAWQAGMDVDWALVAELVLSQDAFLHAVQAQALREFIDAERSANALRVRSGYAGHGIAVRRSP